MEVISLGLDGNIGDLKIEDGRKEYMIKVVDSQRTMGALITKEADPVSARRLRMNKVDKAMWMDIKFHKNKGIAKEGNTANTKKWCNGRCLARMGKQESGFHEFKKMDPNWLEFGMVQKASDQVTSAEIH